MNGGAPGCEVDSLLRGSTLTPALSQGETEETRRSLGRVGPQAEPGNQLAHRPPTPDHRLPTTDSRPPTPDRLLADEAMASSYAADARLRTGRSNGFILPHFGQAFAALLVALDGRAEEGGEEGLGGGGFGFEFGMELNG